MLMQAEPPPEESIWAAGTVVVKVDADGQPRFLLIHRPRYDDWTLPKGKLDKNEPFLDGAIRETWEETGIEPRNPRLVGTIAYHTQNENPKVVRWWLADADDGTFTPNKEVDRIKWSKFEKGRKRLTYRNDREVLDRANDMFLARSAGVIYLVRHGSAGKRGSGDGEDWSRGLDKVGRAQRKAIRRLLQAHPLTRIGSSTYTRCVETVQPLSDRMGIPIELEPALVDGSHLHRTMSLIHSLQEESAVLCSHGDVIADLVGHLFASEVPMDGPMEWKKGSIWELRTIQGRVVSGRYVRPTD